MTTEPRADRAAPDPIREALADANRIIAMMRAHLAADHPDCAYEGLGVMNDASRAALSAPHPDPEPREARKDEQVARAQITGAAWSATHRAMRQEGVSEDHAMAWADVVRIEVEKGLAALRVEPSSIDGERAKAAMKTVAFAMETHHQGAPASLLREWSRILRDALTQEATRAERTRE